MRLFAALNLDRLRRGTEPSTAIDSALNQVYLTLHQIQRKRQFIEVSFDGDDAIYQSMILDLDPQTRTLLIDELFPRGFEGLAGQSVTVSVRQQLGRKLRFQTVIVEALRDDRTPLYTLAMPATVEGDQRRSAYRLPVNRHQIEPKFIAPNNNSHKAQLNNVSVAGVGLELQGDFSTDLNVGDELNQLYFDFAGIDVSCDLSVKSVQAIDGGECPSTLIGGEFVGLPAREQRLLAKCIANMQRQRIQHVD